MKSAHYASTFIENTEKDENNQGKHVAKVIPKCYISNWWWENKGLSVENVYHKGSSLWILIKHLAATLLKLKKKSYLTADLVELVREKMCKLNENVYNSFFFWPR